MTSNKAALTRDANNRAFRTILQNLAFDILLAVSMLLLPLFSTANGWDDFEWKVMAFSVFRTVMVTIFAWINRQVLDPSPIPTPLPPDPPGEPDADHPEPAGIHVVEHDRKPGSPPQRRYPE